MSRALLTLEPREFHDFSPEVLTLPPMVPRWPPRQPPGWEPFDPDEAWHHFVTVTAPEPGGPFDWSRATRADALSEDAAWWWFALVTEPGVLRATRADPSVVAHLRRRALDRTAAVAVARARDYHLAHWTEHPDWMRAPRTGPVFRLLSRVVDTSTAFMELAARISWESWQLGADLLPPEADDQARFAVVAHCRLEGFDLSDRGQRNRVADLVSRAPHREWAERLAAACERSEQHRHLDEQLGREAYLEALQKNQISFSTWTEGWIRELFARGGFSAAPRIMTEIDLMPADHQPRHLAEAARIHTWRGVRGWLSLSVDSAVRDPARAWLEAEGANAVKGALDHATDRYVGRAAHALVGSYLARGHGALARRALASVEVEVPSALRTAIETARDAPP